MELEFKEGGSTAYTYTPANAPNLASQRWTAESTPDSSEFEGFVLDSPAINHQSIREGLYDRAQVDIYVVNWRYPWAGHFRHDRYWMHDIDYSGELWTAEIRSLMAQIEFILNRVHNKRCDENLFGERCKVEETGDYAAKDGEVAVVDSLSDGPDHARMRFEGGVSDDFNTHPASGYAAAILDNWWRHGTLTWTSGNNVITGKSSYEVQYFNRTYATLQLWTPTPHDIEVGDTFTIRCGCDKSMHGHCRKKFDNIANYQGFAMMPTAKRMAKAGAMVL